MGVAPAALGARKVRHIVRVVLVVTLAIAVLVGVMWLAQRRFIYFPSQVLPDVATVLPGAEEVTFPTDDGLTLAGWLVPAVGDANGATVVVFSGNAGNRGDRVLLASSLAGRGYGVLLVGYRGYGGNPGTPTEDGLLADGRAAVAFLEARLDIDANRLVYFGESLGAAVAIGVAEERPPAALVLRSPFTSLTDVASVHYPFFPVSFLLRDRYPSLERIRGIDVPVLVVAGSADSVVPAAQSQRLFDAVSGPKEFVMIEGADHNDYELTTGDRLVDAMALFLDDVFLPGSG
ncbi:putative aminoacrylate hydrolase RutD [bacterium BMS3Bbin02]|nr:putative aminoacrylate hydrolase RutD [bacterium BMS3Bbin02]